MITYTCLENVDLEWRIVTPTHARTRTVLALDWEKEYAEKEKTNKNLWTKNNDFPLAIPNNKQTQKILSMLLLLLLLLFVVEHK